MDRLLDEDEVHKRYIGAGDWDITSLCEAQDAKTAKWIIERMELHQDNNGLIVLLREDMEAIKEELKYG